MKELQAGFMTAVSGSAVQPHICIKFETVEAMQAAHLALLSLAQPGEGALTGWKLVPIEPDLAMLFQGARSLIDGQEGRPGSSWGDEAKLAYRAMLDAAPPPGITSTPTGDSNG